MYSNVIVNTFLRKLEKAQLCARLLMPPPPWTDAQTVEVNGSEYSASAHRGFAM